MVTAKLYVESSDDSREQGIRSREGWNEFFNRAGIGRRVCVVRGGDRRRTLERLVISATRPQSDIVSFALVDRKHPITEGQTVWQHLKESYGWDRPRTATDDPEVLAVPAPESAYARLTTELADVLVSRLNVALGRHHQQVYGAESGAASTLQDTSQPTEIIAVLRGSGLAGVANRLDHLRQLEHTEQDADDLPLALDSLRELARFLIEERWLPEPEIGASPDGFAHAEWRFDDGLLVMEFLCSGQIRFAAIASRTQAMDEPSRMHGTSSRGDALRALRPFTDQLQPV